MPGAAQAVKGSSGGIPNQHAAGGRRGDVASSLGQELVGNAMDLSSDVLVATLVALYALVPASPSVDVGRCGCAKSLGFTIYNSLQGWDQEPYHCVHRDLACYRQLCE